MLKNTLCKYSQSRFHFNGHAKGLYPQTQTGYCKVKTTPSFTQAVKGLLIVQLPLLIYGARDTLQYLMRTLASLIKEARVQTS